MFAHSTALLIEVNYSFIWEKQCSMAYLSQIGSDLINKLMLKQA